MKRSCLVDSHRRTAPSSRVARPYSGDEEKSTPCPQECPLPGDETAAELNLPPPPLTDWLRPFGGIKVDRRRLAIHDQSRMGLIVLLLFAVPLLIGVAVAAVKALEVVANRDIASARRVAISTVWAVAIAVAVSGVAGVVYLMIVTSNDPS